MEKPLPQPGDDDGSGRVPRPNWRGPFRPLPKGEQTADGFRRTPVMNCFVNLNVLCGLVVSDPKQIQTRDGSVVAAFTMQLERIGPEGQTLPHSLSHPLVKTFGITAQKVLDRVEKFDVVLVVGHLERDGYGQRFCEAGSPIAKRGPILVNADYVRIMPIRRGFRKGSVLVPVAEFRRLKLLEKHFDPEKTWVPPEALERYSLDDLVEPDEMDGILE